MEFAPLAAAAATAAEQFRGLHAYTVT